MKQINARAVGSSTTWSALAQTVKVEIGWIGLNLMLIALPYILQSFFPIFLRQPEYLTGHLMIQRTFNPALAQEVTDAPESTGPSQSTGTSSNPTLTPASSESSSSKAGPIAGGVVGGVVGLALIAALVFWWIRRRRLGIAPSAEVNYTSVAPTSPPPMSFTAAPLGSSANITSQRFYDPSDPSTYPAPINAPATDYTGSNQVLLTHVTGSTYPGSTVPAGRYTGAPEL
ncbi:hypothetical protein J132_00801 [Termitomyces sp. J132]|nr:hypothetical protein J132_00801 [Termitomyces sp. J132]